MTRLRSEVSFPVLHLAHVAYSLGRISDFATNSSRKVVKSISWCFVVMAGVTWRFIYPEISCVRATSPHSMLSQSSSVDFITKWYSGKKFSKYSVEMNDPRDLPIQVLN